MPEETHISPTAMEPFLVITPTGYSAVGLQIRKTRGRWITNPAERGGNISVVDYNNYSYRNTSRPDILSKIGSTEFTWDAAGNLISIGKNKTNRQLTWTEDNRLIKVTENASPKYHSFYRYDANGERTYKLAYINNSLSLQPHYVFHGATMYPSPFLVITPEGYTKHYYAETERIAAQVGKGKFSNVNSTIANADSTAAKLTAVNGIAPYLTNYTTPKFAYLNTLPALNTTAKEIYYYHTDHLGSSAWITDNLGVAVQHLAYLPWGEPYVTQKTGNFNPTYTFSGKERDEETGYSYFGQRFYYSQLSIWLSVDPMRGKYPSLSPFVYCANNPIKLVDPNGETIWIVGKDGEKTVYSKGMEYEGENTFTAQAVKAINLVSKESSTADKAIDELIESNYNFYVTECDKTYYWSDNIEKYHDKKTIIPPDDGTVYWNPQGTPIWEKSFDKNGILESAAHLGVHPEIDLSHELIHARDHKNSTLFGDMVKKRGLYEREWRSTYFENKIRLEMGYPLRSHYKTNMENGTPKPGLPMLIRNNGKSIFEY